MITSLLKTTLMMHIAIGFALGLATLVAAQECPIDDFLCKQSDGSPVYSPSWCKFHNPFIVPQPPTKLANGSNADLSTYKRLYNCNSTDPFSACQSIHTFSAVEVPSYPNTTTRVIVVAHRMSDDDLANTTLVLYDQNFEVLGVPISGLVGELSLLTTFPNPATGGNTTLIAYGGGSYIPFDGPTPPYGCSYGCGFLDFLEMDLMQPQGLSNSSAAFLTAGFFFEAASRISSVLYFSVNITSSVTHSIDAHLRMREVMPKKGMRDPTPADIPAGPTAMIAYSLYNSDPTSEYFGWSIQFHMYFAASNPYCVFYGGDGNPCMLPIFRATVRNNGQQFTCDDEISIRTSGYFHNCAALNASMGAYAYFPYYNAQNCEETPLLWISTASTVSVFAYQFNVTTFDLALSPMTQVFNLPMLGYGGSTITDMQVWSEVQVRDPQAAFDTKQVPPSAVWAAIASKSAISNAGLLFITRLPQFSDAVGGVYPPTFPPSFDNPAGQPTAATACGWNTYYNGSACNDAPFQVMATGIDGYASSLSVQWRSMPLDKLTILAQTGCLPWNVSCFVSVINNTMTNNNNPPVAPGTKSAPLSVVDLQGGRILFGQLALRAFAGEDPNALAHELLQSFYGNRFNLFGAMSTHQVLVVDLIPLTCNDDALQLTYSISNMLSMMGHVRSIHPTSNAQYLFAAVDRPLFFLESMERIVEVCTQLAANPLDPFLAPFASSCNQAPRLPAISDFLQVGGVCLPGTLCPSFQDEEVGPVAPGSYTIFGFDETPCEPGSICQSGRKSPCPTGFVCPYYGMEIPVQCSVDPTLSSTCYFEGLSDVHTCSPGTLCGTPYLPPMPAPPGYAQSINGGVRSLQICTPGQWCGLGRSTTEVNGSLDCPGGTYCATTDVLEPTICDLGGRCNSSSCPEISYCPSGSIAELLCPAGSFCPDTQSKIYCSAGTYCPSGSPLWQLCPSSAYCPNASAEITCPGGSYCPQGSSEPVKCNQLSHCFCDNGCAEPPFSLMVTALVILVLFIIITFVLWRFVAKPWWQRRKQRLRQERRNRPAHMKAKVEELGELQRSLLNIAEGSGSSSINSAPNRKSLAKFRPGSLRLARKAYTVDITFEALGLKLKNGGKSVLDGVTGSLRHGRVCAVMGPSGAGKTTFLTALCGKASYGNLCGTVNINGVKGLLTETAYRHLVGFVPQEDIMMRDLTVEENIAYAAMTRLPSTWTTESKLSFADSVIDLLGLGDLRDSIIGDEAVRGISGGQRKRVNIGIELAADPTVLFLDEPTSGLDATSSMEVCNALRRIADLGLTVALVLHQPRWEIFNSFDDLLLLGKGGKTVYIGPVTDAVPYFEKNLGVHCPDRVNPADFLLDVVGGDPPADWKAAHPDFRPSDLFDVWEAHQQDKPNSHSPIMLSRPPPKHNPVGFFGLLWQYLHRSCVQQFRHPLTLLLDNLLIFVSAFFLAVVYFGTPSYGAPEPIEVFQGCAKPIAQSCQTCLAEGQDSILNRGVMTIISLSLTGVATFLRVLGTERVVYWREASSISQPKHTLAYFLGKDLSMVPQMLFGPMVFTMAYEALTTPRAGFGQYYLIFLGVYWCSSAFGYLTSVLAPASLAQLLGVVTIFSNAMFAGGQPTLKEMLKKFIPLCYLPYISYMRYALEAIYVVEVVNYDNVVALQGLDLHQLVADTFGFDLSAAPGDVAVLFTIGLIIRVVAVIAMMLKDRDKKL